MKPSLSSQAGDRLFTFAAVALAVTSAGFGGAMVLRLESMRNPPAVMGLDFSKLRKIEGPSGHQADPITTGSIGRVRPKPQAGQLRRSGNTDPAGLEFRLLSVIDGVAFVEVSGPSGKELWPVDEGATLPGAGKVLGIRRNANRWQVSTSSLTISGEAQ